MGSVQFTLKGTNVTKSKKNALRAFLIFSEADCDAERFHCHHTPKHFAAGVVVMVFPAMTMVSGGCSCLDSLITPSFDTFNLRHLLVVNSSIMLTWSLKRKKLCEYHQHELRLQHKLHEWIDHSCSFSYVLAEYPSQLRTWLETILILA